MQAPCFCISLFLVGLLEQLQNSFVAAVDSVSSGYPSREVGTGTRKERDDLTVFLFYNDRTRIFYYYN